MRHNQAKRVKVFNKIIIQISVTKTICSRSLNIIEINYSTLFLNLFWQCISTENISEVLYFKFFYPVKQIKITQWFGYKIEPKIGIELKGLFFPSNRPFPCTNWIFPTSKERWRLINWILTSHHVF